MNGYYVFQVTVRNLDVEEGEFPQNTFGSQDDAIASMRRYFEGKQASNIVEDLTGQLKEYDERNLQYGNSNGKVAIYYRTHWGSYRSVVYLKPIFIQ